MAAPNTSYSLSGNFSPGGKFFVIVAFLFGKNRALPETSDPVIQFSFPALVQILHGKETLHGDSTTKGLVKSPMREDPRRSTVTFRESSATRNTDADYEFPDESFPDSTYGL